MADLFSGKVMRNVFRVLVFKGVRYGFADAARVRISRREARRYTFGNYITAILTWIIMKL